MNFIESFFLHTVVPELFSLITGWQKDHFAQIVKWVQEAEAKFTVGDQKKQFVIQQIEQVVNDALPWMLNFAVELGVAYAKKANLIP